jgi:4-hydroxybenzoate polyprenyltransferase
MSVNLPKIAGVLVALDIFAVYVYSLRIKRLYPPSHPWSGISLAFLAVFLLGSYIRGNRINVPGWVAVLVTMSATLWTVAAILMN